MRWTIGEATIQRLTVETAALAQLGEKFGPLAEHRHEIRNTRLLRHDAEYQSELTGITQTQAEASLDTATATRDVAMKLVPVLSLF